MKKQCGLPFGATIGYNACSKVGVLKIWDTVML